MKNGFQGFRRSSDVIYFPAGALLAEYNFSNLFKFYLASQFESETHFNSQNIFRKFSLWKF